MQKLQTQNSLILLQGDAEEKLSTSFSSSGNPLPDPECSCLTNLKPFP